MASFPALSQNIATEGWGEQTVEACERAGALLLLVLLAPVLVPAPLVLWALSRQTPLIAHRRVGWQGSDLWMLKLRTMWGADSSRQRGHGWIDYIDDERGPARKQAVDSRVPNAFARFCRRHSIDELPQLWHVARGEMRLVGPRPITRRELRQYYRAQAAEILQAKPGIAGLWQTSGRNRLSYPERLRLDLEFVRRRSWSMYARIVVAAIREICTGANAW